MSGAVSCDRIAHGGVALVRTGDITMRKTIGLAWLALVAGVVAGGERSGRRGAGRQDQRRQRRQGEEPRSRPGSSGASSAASRSPSRETKRVEWPKAYKEATEKYAPQVKLSADGLTVKNYVAGQPFPNIDPKDPQFAQKMMWNYEYGFVNGIDDTDLRNFDADTGSIPQDGPMTVERHFLLDHFRRLFWTGRLYVDPKPDKPNPNGYRAQQGLYPILEPFDLKGVGALGNRYTESRSRTTRGSTCRRSAACGVCRPRSAPTRSSGRTPTSTATTAMPATSPGWTGSTWARRRSSRRVHAEHFPVKWDEKVDWAFDDVWEKRKVYVDRGHSKLPQYAYSKRVLFIDKESWGIPYSDIYDRSGELWKIWINDISFRKTVPGNNAIVYDDEMPFAPGDRHGGHAARARDQGVAAEPALPGRAGLVLPPGREGGRHRRLVHGRRAGGSRPLSSTSIRASTSGALPPGGAPLVVWAAAPAATRARLDQRVPPLLLEPAHVWHPRRRRLRPALPPAARGDRPRVGRHARPRRARGRQPRRGQPHDGGQRGARAAAPRPGDRTPSSSRRPAAVRGEAGRGDHRGGARVCRRPRARSMSARRCAPGPRRAGARSTSSPAGLRRSACWSRPPIAGWASRSRAGRAELRRRGRRAPRRRRSRDWRRSSRPTRSPRSCSAPGARASRTSRARSPAPSRPSSGYAPLARAGGARCAREGRRAAARGGHRGPRRRRTRARRWRCAKALGLDPKRQLQDGLGPRRRRGRRPAAAAARGGARARHRRATCILVCGYGDGADAIVLPRHRRALAAAASRRAADRGEADAAVVRPLRALPRSSCARSRACPTWRRRSSPSAIARSCCRCTAAGARAASAVQFPRIRACIECGHRRRARRRARSRGAARVFTFTHDYLHESPDPPTTHAVVDLDGGGRIYLQLTDCEADRVAVDMPVELTFRRLHDGGGFHNYFWKARPA